MGRAAWALAGLLALLLTLGCQAKPAMPTATASPTSPPPVVEARASPSAVPSPTVTGTLTPTFTPAPQPTATPTRSPTPIPTPYVVAEYPEQRADGSIWLVRQWSDGTYTASLVATPTPVPPTTTPTPSSPPSTATLPSPAPPPPAPTAYPTPNPAHPPQTGTLTGYWEPYLAEPKQHELWAMVGDCDSRQFDFGGPDVRGPFMNLAFTEEYVGKTLTVSEQAKTCLHQPDGCQSPALFLLRSFVGEVQAGQRMYIRRLERPYDPPNPCFNAELVIWSGGYIRWPIAYGQYILFWATFNYTSVDPSTWSLPPNSVTYTVSITD